MEKLILFYIPIFLIFGKERKVLNSHHYIDGSIDKLKNKTFEIKLKCKS